MLSARWNVCVWNTLRVVGTADIVDLYLIKIEAAVDLSRV